MAEKRREKATSLDVRLALDQKDFAFGVAQLLFLLSASFLRPTVVNFVAPA
jgi:hypothetical protein